MKIKCFCFLLLQIAINTYSQQPILAKPSQKNEIVPRYKLKLNFFDQSVFSMPCIKVHNEFLIGGETNYHYNYVSADIGYNYYSADEAIKAKGLYTGLRFNHYVPGYSKVIKCISLGIFYQHSVLRDYLKTTSSYPGLGTIYEYQRMKFQKERYGANLEILKQYPIFNQIFIELGGSMGVISMETITPEKVTQTTFVNGVSYNKKVVLPTIGFSLKVGYNIY